MNIKWTILVTDSLFIFSEHEKEITDAWYKVERLDNPNASEDELIVSLKGKVGYILWWIEKVTDKVIESTNDLKVISFTWTDWRQFIPGYKSAKEKWIKISNTPWANSYAVAEYTILSILAMTRNFSELTNNGNKKFQTTTSLNDMIVGIIWMWKIWIELVKMLKWLWVKKILYFSRSRRLEIEEIYDIKFCTLDDLLKTSDVVSLHFSKEAWNSFIWKDQLSLMKDNSILVNCWFTGAIDKDDLYLELSNWRIRAFQDDPMDERYNLLPKYIWQCSNSHTAFNTYQANKIASDMATKSMLNLLEGKSDEYLVL